jgi:hypothetical protein
MEGAWVLAFCRWAIGLAFGVSALGKATAMASFRAALADFGVLPQRLNSAVAITTLGAEVLVVGLVAAGRWLAVAGLCLALALLAVFSATLTAALRRKAEVSCNCFGSGARQVSRYDLARNAVLGACCVAGLLGYRESSAWHPSLALAVLLGLMAAVSVTVAVNLEDIVELLRKPYLFE